MSGAERVGALWGPDNSSGPPREGRLDATVRDEPHERDDDVDRDRHPRHDERQRDGGGVVMRMAMTASLKASSLLLLMRWTLRAALRDSVEP